MNPGLEIKYLTYSELDSTQSEAWRYLEENEPLGWTAIAADWQTQGRGQRGSGWQNGRKGNVFLSVLSPPLRFPAEHLAALQAQLAVSAVEALQDCGLPGSRWTPQAAEPNGPHWGVKWPNDLVLGGRKLGGILVEGRMQHILLQRLVVGVGVNLVAPPEDVPHAVSWSEWETPPPADRLCRALVDRLVLGLRTVLELPTPSLWGVVSPRYTEILWGLGAPQELSGRTSPEQKHTVLLVEPTEDGRMRVLRDGVPEALHQGEWVWSYPLQPTARATKDRRSDGPENY